MKPAAPTTVRSHPVMEGPGDPGSGDTVGLRAKTEPTDRRAEQAPGSPEEYGARVQKDFGTGGGARFARSRPPDDDDGSHGGRAVSAQSPMGTVMGLRAWRLSCCCRMDCLSAEGMACEVVGNADVFARQRLQPYTLRLQPIGLGGLIPRGKCRSYQAAILVVLRVVGVGRDAS